MSSNLQVISTVKTTYTKDLYKIVDALNRTLKEDNLVFGLSLDREDQEQAVFTIYRA